jgi:hypothetical protein
MHPAVEQDARQRHRDHPLDRLLRRCVPPGNDRDRRARQHQRRRGDLHPLRQPARQHRDQPHRRDQQNKQGNGWISVTASCFRSGITI